MSDVKEDSYIPVNKDQLKDEQKTKLKRATDDYEQECLKSFSATRSGEVFRKFNFSTPQLLIEVQRENKMLDAVHQAVGHAFVSHAPIMTNSVHNVVVKILQEGGLQGYVGPVYQQAIQMIFAPTRSSTTVPPVTP